MMDCYGMQKQFRQTFFIEPARIILDTWWTVFPIFSYYKSWSYTFGRCCTFKAIIKSSQRGMLFHVNAFWLRNGRDCNLYYVLAISVIVTSKYTRRNSYHFKFDVCILLSVLKIVYRSNFLYLCSWNVVFLLSIQKTFRLFYNLLECQTFKYTTHVWH